MVQRPSYYRSGSVVVEKTYFVYVETGNTSGDFLHFTQIMEKAISPDVALEAVLNRRHLTSVRMAYTQIKHIARAGKIGDVRYIVSECSITDFNHQNGGVIINGQLIMNHNLWYRPEICLGF
jgi:hypothetical protein